MANNSPTIVAASLSDDQLKKSIDSLVTHVDEAMKKMVQSTNNAVGEMEAKLKSLGNLKINSGGSADGGASKRAKAQNAETAAIEKSNQAAKEKIMTLDQEQSVIQKTIDAQNKLFYARTMKIPTGQYDMQIAKLERIQAMLERYRRGEMSFSPSQVSGLEKEERTLLHLLGQVNAAQQQVTSSTQQTTQAAQRYTEEIRKQAQAIRESAEYKAGKNVLITTPNGYDATINIKDRKSIEDKLTETYQKHIGQKSELDRLEQTDNEIAKERLGTETAITNEISKRKKYVSPETQIDYDVTRDKLAQIIATRNNIEKNQVVNWDEQTSSIKTLSAALKQYQEAYVKMSATERNSPFGKQMIADMQVLERNIQKFRRQMARPIDFESVMNLPQKTLDDIAYKMRQLASYRSGLNVETQTKEIDQVNRKYAELQKKMNDIMQKNTDMIASNTALGRSWNYMKNRLAFYFTVGASTSFVKNLIDIRSQYELLERSIGILFDSMQTGSKIFSELNQMAIKSPFTTMELGSAAKQLSAYNIAAKDVVDTTRRLADMAAAVGIPIERLTYALGQIKSYGYLNSRDARMFANAGIPLIQNLADMYTKLEGRLVSIGDVYDRIKKKQVSFEDTLKVVHEMTDEGGRFFNFQEKAADTLKVRLANLTLAWNNMLNNMGKSNQGVLTSGLGVLKEMFENWRKIENLVLAIATNFGTVKAIQLLILLNAKGVTKQMALQEVLGKKLGATIYGMARNLKMLAVNPMTWLTVAITAVTYLSWKFWDLTTANENFNKSIADGTKENIASIDKFFDKYKKDIESVGSMNTTDQEKMWERVREEIEKTTKNAQQYIDILEKIPELDKRVSKASGFLEKEKVIQEELNRLAQHGYFNIGGGFADDSYAEALTTIDKYTGEMIRKYGTYEDYIKAFKNEFQGFYDEFRDVKFSWNINEEIDESVKHFKKLENLNWGRILSGGTDEEKLARIRDAFMSLRDNFFATEEMQNAGAEAQALYNRHMDYWITSVAKANGLIKELTVNGKTYTAEDVAAVEERRTEWELFFSYLSDEQRKTMDYLVKTNQTGGEEFKKLWDTMSDSMKKSNASAYRDLQKKIAELRETPDIVINVVYREMRDKLDKQQQDFEDRWIKPKNWSVRGLSAEDYLNEETANRTKYGRLMRKTEEDNVEWEERLGKEYQENAKKIKSLNAQLQNKNKLSEADREQKEKDLNLYTDLNKAIDDIGKTENFNYDQFKKGGKGSKKDPLLDALKQEISLVEKLQSDYDKLSKSGASQADALDTIRGAYGKTIRLLNAQLGKYGLPQLDILQLITGKDPNKALAHFKQTLNTLISKGLLTLERSKELEAVVEKFTLSAKTYNLDMITKGLNNELGKLKDEYELAVELDADPELGDMFADMFGINTSTLPHSFSEALDRAQTIINRKLAEMNITTPFDLMEGNIDSFAKATGLDKDGAVIKELVSAQNAYRDMFKKNITETEKVLDDYIKKYGDYSDKIAEIEAGRLEKLKKLNEAYYTEEMRKRPEYIAKLNAIEQGAKKEKQQVDFDEFKNSRYYTMMFENLDYISTKTIRDMRDRVRELIDTMNDLTPEQLKTIMSQYEKLEQKLVKRSPFKTLSKDLKEYFSTTKERKAANVEFKNAQKEYDAQKKNVAALKEKYEQAKANNYTSQSYLDFLQIEINSEDEILKILKEQLDAAQKKADKYNLIKKLALSEAELALKTVAANLSSLKELRDNLQESFGFEFSDDFNLAVEGLSRAGDGMSKAMSALKEGNVVAAISGVVDVVKGLGDTVAGVFGAGRRDYLTSYIERFNKLVEIMDRANEIQMKSLENMSGSQAARKYLEIKNNYDNIIKGYTEAAKRGGSSGGSAYTHTYAYRTNERLKDSWEEISKYAGETLTCVQDMYSLSPEQLKEIMVNAPELWSRISPEIRENFEKAAEYGDKYEELIEKLGVALTGISLNDVTSEFEQMLQDMESSTEDFEKDFEKNMRNAIIRSMMVNTYSKELEDWYTNFKKRIEDDTLSGSDVEQLRQEYMEIVRRAMKERDHLLEAVGSTSSNELSALQQGIQGITEDTAGALEAYMNGVSQQVYLHSDLLTQIRDAVVGFDIDIQTASLSQILLQLQSSYQVQMSIQGILEGVLTPSGRAFSVELLS